MPLDPDLPPLVMAITTEASPEKAEALARAVLEARLAACVSLIPQTSLYHWQGKLETSQEVQMLFKTPAARLEPLETLVLSLHSYETPEWVHWPASCSPAYGQWLQASAGPPG
jgi:periplasmic divalent cation tolerance protein